MARPRTFLVLIFAVSATYSLSSSAQESLQTSEASLRLQKKREALNSRRNELIAELGRIEIRMGRVQIREVSAKASCKSYGCGSYKPGQSCQCNNECEKFDSCCYDYVPTCKENCKSYGCGGFSKGRSCQCNPQCAKYKSCCADYKEVCEGNGTHVEIDPGTETLLQKVDAWMIRRVDWDHRQRRLKHLLKTYDEGYSKRRDTYDNALAAIYFTMRGKLREADDILKFAIDEMYNGKPHGKSVDTSNLPSHSTHFALLAASYGDWNQVDTAVDVGNNAWMGIAFARYAAATQKKCYALVAQDIVKAIDNERGCSDSLGGFMQRLQGAPMNDRSTEHNIDMKSLGRMLQNDAIQQNAEKFIEHMYAPYNGTKGKYLIGTKEGDKCNADINYDMPFIADTTFWNIAADGDAKHPHNMATALKSALDEVDGTDEYRGQKYHGVKFTGGGTGIQWEVTASAVIGMAHFLNTSQKVIELVPDLPDLLKGRLEVYRESIKRLIQEDGYVRGSVLQQGSATGIGGHYPHGEHLAATAWAGMMLIHQGSAAVPVNPIGNPYATPPNAIPSHETEHATECIPAQSRGY